MERIKDFPNALHVASHTTTKPAIRRRTPPTEPPTAAPEESVGPLVVSVRPMSPVDVVNMSSFGAKKSMSTGWLGCLLNIGIYRQTATPEKYLTKEECGNLHEREKEINKLTRREVKGMLNKNICFFKLGKKFEFNRSFRFVRLACFCENEKVVYRYGKETIQRASLIDCII